MIFFIFLLFCFVLKGQGQCPLVCHCDEHDKTAQCAQQDLEAVPENLPWFVQELIISENKIKKVPKDAFPKKNNIQEGKQFMWHVNLHSGLNFLKRPN
jgi:hypothetical protein